MKKSKTKAKPSASYYMHVVGAVVTSVMPVTEAVVTKSAPIARAVTVTTLPVMAYFQSKDSQAQAPDHVPNFTGYWHGPPPNPSYSQVPDNSSSAPTSDAAIAKSDRENQNPTPPESIQSNPPATKPARK